MISDKICYSFNQIELALIGFCANLQLKLQNLVPNLPVFIMNTGDFSYMVDKKFVETKNEEIYLKTPRVVLNIEDIQPNTQEDTNQYNKIFYTFDNKDGRGPINYQCVARRKAYNLQIVCNFVSPNFIQMLNHFEVMSTLAARDNVYTYEFLGNTIQAAYTVQQMGKEVPSLDMGQGGTRNINYMTQIELQVHLLVPRVETIIEADKVGYERIQYDITIKNQPEQPMIELGSKPQYGDVTPPGVVIPPKDKEDNPDDEHAQEGYDVFADADTIKFDSPGLLYKSGSLVPKNIKFK